MQQQPSHTDFESSTANNNDNVCIIPFLRMRYHRTIRKPACTLRLGVRDVNSLNADSSLADLGLDSLMGVEIRQILERDYDIIMAMREIRQLTINKLREMVDSKPVGACGMTAHTHTHCRNDI